MPLEYLRFVSGLGCGLKPWKGKPSVPDGSLTAARAIEPSPFPGDTDVYFGGHDCAVIMSTHSAWIYKAPLREVLRPSGP